jgi:hypothetical protein
VCFSDWKGSVLNKWILDHVQGDRSSIKAMLTELAKSIVRSNDSYIYLFTHFHFLESN